MSNGPLAPERRNHPRKRPLSLVYVELSAANGGMLRDLSEHGFAMRAMMPLRVGETTPFSFALNAATRFHGHCKVLWVEEDGRVAGFQFTEVPAGFREQIGAWLCEKQEHLPAKSGVAAEQSSTLAQLREELRNGAPRQDITETEKPQPVVVQSAFSKAKERIHVVPIPATESTRAELPHVKLKEIASQPPPVLEALPPLDPLPVKLETVVSSDAFVASPSMSRSYVNVAVRMMMVLALIAGAMVYHRSVGTAIMWLGQKITGDQTPEVLPTPSSGVSPQLPPVSTSPHPAPVTNETASAPPLVNENKDAASVPDKKPADVPTVADNAPSLPAKNPPAAAPDQVPATNRTTTFSTPAAPASDAGVLEYQAAQELLKNQSTEAGFSEAVRLLWVAVEKGNSNAEIALAELYRVGHGVARNCDQTRILLTAAAKKGNSEAQKRLNRFLAEGCE